MSAGSQEGRLLVINLRHGREFNENIGGLAGEFGVHSREKPQGEIFDSLSRPRAVGVTLRILLCDGAAR